MSRSDYYPRKRARIQSREPQSSPKDNGKSGPRGIGPCAVCHAYLPVVLHDGLLYVQAPFGLFCEKAPEEICPWKLHLEAGVNSAIGSTLPSNCVRSEVYPA